MTLRMEQNPVVSLIAAASGAPEDMVIVPAGELGDFALTDRAQPLLLLPKIKQLPPTFEVLSHLQPKPLFKVRFPGRVIRISGGFDFEMTFYR